MFPQADQLPQFPVHELIPVLSSLPELYFGCILTKQERLSIGKDNRKMRREYYSDTIVNFLKTSSNEILGKLAQSSKFALEQTQRDAWLEEIRILQNILKPHKGSIYFEYSIPRMGKRIDVVLLIGSAIFVLEFKVGEKVV